MKAKRQPAKKLPIETEVASGCSIQRFVSPTRLSKSLLRHRYTRTVKQGKGFATYLQIGDQGFSVVENATYARAQWFRKMLAVALERLLSANDKDQRPGT